MELVLLAIYFKLSFGFHLSEVAQSKEILILADPTARAESSHSFVE